jgi:hypothetical protein
MRAAFFFSGNKDLHGRGLLSTRSLTRTQSNAEGCHCISHRGAHGYQVWITANDPAIAANWEAIGYTTRVRHLATDLESYKAYWFCVSAIGSAGEGA